MFYQTDGKRLPRLQDERSSPSGIKLADHFRDCFSVWLSHANGHSKPAIAQLRSELAETRSINGTQHHRGRSLRASLLRSRSLRLL